MVLSHEQIKSTTIIIDGIDSNYENASYDLRVENIIDMDGKEHNEIKISPQGMMYIIFKEKIVLDNNTIGFAHVKTSLTQKGIMATNIGIIDPGYNGYISTLLINFSKTPFFIKKGNAALRVTFNEVKPFTEKKPSKNGLDFTKYVEARQSDTDRLGEKFLNLSQIEREVAKTLIKWLFGVGLFFTAANFFLNVYSRYEKKHEIIMQEQVNQNNERVNNLLQSNDSLKMSIDSLKKVQSNFTKKIDSLGKVKE
jgi:deoxycytidine triphosphate deaminase